MGPNRQMRDSLGRQSMRRRCGQRRGSLHGAAQPPRNWYSTNTTSAPETRCRERSLRCEKGGAPPGVDKSNVVDHGRGEGMRDGMAVAGMLLAMCWRCAQGVGFTELCEGTVLHRSENVTSLFWQVRAQLLHACGIPPPRMQRAKEKIAYGPERRGAVSFSLDGLKHGAG